MHYSRWKFFLSKPFLTLAILGGMLLLIALTNNFGNMSLEETERWGLALCGLGLLTGGGFSKVLRHDPAECNITLYQILARIGFMLVGPGAVLMNLDILLLNFSWWGCLLGCAVTVVPFGVSLIYVIWKRQKSL